MPIRYIIVILLNMIVLLCTSCSTSVTIEVKPDKESLIRNPAMGWGIYADNRVRESAKFWKDMGDFADRYCTFLYIRVPWSYMEPEKGKYAWLYDENYKSFISEAKKRGLRLHFRVFYDSQDMPTASTPDYVRLNGAKGFLSNTGFWSPYADDRQFQKSLSEFLSAFAAEYDDPSFVDCIDAFNLGWWGEGHHVKLLEPADAEKTYLQIAGLYASAFHKVLLAINYHNEITEHTLKEIVDRYDFILRHDAFGSQWYGNFERGFARKYGFPERPVIAESCYWFVGTDKGERINPDGTDDTERWRNDEFRPDMESWRDVYIATYDDAEEAHANTLDLREVREARSWIAEAPDLVEKFMTNCGYRFTPIKVTFPKKINRQDSVSLCSEWINTGFGMLPDNNSRWNGKYHPAYALFDKKGNTIHILGIDSDMDLSKCVRDFPVSSCMTVSAGNISKGEYEMAVAIADTTTMRPGIALSATGMLTVDGWLLLGKVKIK